MRIVADSIVRGTGTMGFVCECLDDMWAVYNLIQQGDRVQSYTLRKVAVGAQAAATERVRLKLEVRVAELLFDPEQAEIRVSGVVCSECEHVRLGAFHTLELTERQPFYVHKDEWDETALAGLRRARAGVPSHVELVALMIEAGSAQVCCVSKGLTVVRAKIEAAIPKKRSGDARHAEATARFFEAVLAALVRSSDWERSSSSSSSSSGEEEGGGGGGGPAKPPTLLIASPGSTKEAFRAYLAEAVASRPAAELRGLGRAQVLCASAAAGSKWALGDALGDPRVAALLGGLAATEEVALMGAWQTLLAREPERAQYGWRHCAAAVERGVVEHLLVSDRLSRTGSKEARADVARLVERARAAKGRVTLLSSMHASGEHLSQMGGLVATLRYVVHDLDEAAEEQAGAPGQRRGGGEAAGAAAGEGGAAGSGGGGGGGGGGSGSAAGHRLQEAAPGAAAAAAPRPAAKDRFGVAFDTDSDRSDDSDA